jgi:hypothetical protein
VTGSCEVNNEPSGSVSRPILFGASLSADKLRDASQQSVGSRQIAAIEEAKGLASHDYQA